MIEAYKLERAAWLLVLYQADSASVSEDGWIWCKRGIGFRCVA